MRTTLATISLAAAIGLVCCPGAGAAPTAPAMKEAVTAASLLRQAQYRERHTRHGIVKCYRTLVIGRYRCHYYRRY